MVNTDFIVQFHTLLSRNNWQFTTQGKASMFSRYSPRFIRQLSSFSASKTIGTTTADRKPELGHIAPVHSTTCVKYPDRLLAQNTIYFINKSLLNTKLHLPAWQQLTDCDASINPEQTFCILVLLPCAAGRCACLAGTDMRSSWMPTAWH